MPRCTALTKLQKQCKNKAKDGSSFCNVHQSTNYCTGVTLKGEACKAQRFKETLFCKHHQNQTDTLATNYDLFRVPDFVENNRNVVMHYRNSTDAYTSNAILETPELNLDHVVEQHLIRDCYDLVPSTADDKTCLFFYTKHISNNVENLNFTSKKINQAKHCAVKSFCEDYRDNRCHVDGLRHYLAQKRFDEDVCSRISQETRLSMEYMTSALEDHDKMLENLSDIMEKMVL